MPSHRGSEPQIAAQELASEPANMPGSEGHGSSRDLFLARRAKALRELSENDPLREVWLRPWGVMCPLEWIYAFRGTPWNCVPQFQIPLAAWWAAAIAGAEARDYLLALWVEINGEPKGDPRTWDE